MCTSDLEVGVVKFYCSIVNERSANYFYIKFLTDGADGEVVDSDRVKVLYIFCLVFFVTRNSP
jgi:hypothetical protein